MSRYGFGNQGHYRGDTLTDMLEAQESKLQYRKQNLADRLAEQMGYPAFYAWWDALPGDNLENLVSELEHKLDEFECSCRPDGDKCAGCKARDEVRRM